MSHNTTTQTEGMKGEVTITIQVPAGNAFDFKKKKENLERFASLDMETQERVEKLLSSPKALDYIKNKWVLMKTFLGI